MYVTQVRNVETLPTKSKPSALQ
eukprot:COSAG01_NODE_54206_length_333_cov_2.170940_1_plen_22_part_10